MEKALHIALEALEKISVGGDPRRADLAITAIKAALEAKDEPVAFKIYKPTPPRRAIPNVRDAELPWVYDQDPSSGNVASMWVTPVKATPPQQEAKDEPVAWKYDVTYNQDGTVSVALPDGDELRIVLPNQQEPYCWTWDVWVSGGKWRAEYGWEKPTEKVVNLQPLYTSPPQRKPLTDEEITEIFSTTKGLDFYLNFARAIEAAHGIKGEA